jgi:hypothetical protein
MGMKATTYLPDGTTRVQKYLHGRMLQDEIKAAQKAAMDEDAVTFFEPPSYQREQDRILVAPYGDGGSIVFAEHELQSSLAKGAFQLLTNREKKMRDRIHAAAVRKSGGVPTPKHHAQAKAEEELRSRLRAAPGEDAPALTARTLGATKGYSRERQPLQAALAALKRTGEVVTVGIGSGKNTTYSLNSECKRRAKELYDAIDVQEEMKKIAAACDSITRRALHTGTTPIQLQRLRRQLERI